jgi:cellobiose phosphorylase
VSEALLASLHAEAEHAGLDPGVFIERALQEYVATRRREQDEARMATARTRLDALSEKLGGWDPVSIIRGFRDGTPPNTTRRRRRR